MCDLYRYTDTALGDFTAYEEEGNLWLPENDGVTFWQDWMTDDHEARLLYKIFQNY